jgi:hypothetical protein
VGGDDVAAAFAPVPGGAVTLPDAPVAPDPGAPASGPAPAAGAAPPDIAVPPAAVAPPVLDRSADADASRTGVLGARLAAAGGALAAVALRPTASPHTDDAVPTAAAAPDDAPEADLDAFNAWLRGLAA